MVYHFLQHCHALSFWKVCSFWELGLIFMFKSTLIWVQPHLSLVTSLERSYKVELTYCKISSWKASGFMHEINQGLASHFPFAAHHGEMAWWHKEDTGVWARCSSFESEFIIVTVGTRVKYTWSYCKLGPINHIIRLLKGLNKIFSASPGV